MTPIIRIKRVDLIVSKELSKLYEGIANLGGAAFFDAGSITTDGADGLHLTAEAEKKLGTAVAAKVKEIMK
jgi:lysophospholipase L1-like esterase